ncbi:MAG: hypothetical protein NTV22_17465 [bacterium]|nr:hypothetical protein [bacterium]
MNGLIVSDCGAVVKLGSRLEYGIIMAARIGEIITYLDEVFTKKAKPVFMVRVYLNGKLDWERTPNGGFTKQDLRQFAQINLALADSVDQIAGHLFFMTSNE